MSYVVSILFFIKRTRKNSKGLSLVFCRITYEGKRAEFSTGRSIDPDRWNPKTNKALGKSMEATTLNQHLILLRNKIHKIADRFAEQEIPISAGALKEEITGKVAKAIMVLEIFEEHNEEVRSLIGNGYAELTAVRYGVAKDHLERYIKYKFKKTDYPIKDIDYKFVKEYEYFLKTRRKCAHNTAVKYISNFKKIIRIALAHDWIDKDPFYHWKPNLKVVDREFLTKEEIQQLIDKDLGSDRLNQVKDIFVFCCFTGLAYIDIKNLRMDDIVIGLDGEKWIKTRRTKTKTRTNIPLLAVPASLIEKYKDRVRLPGEEGILPVPTNQRMNGYLKEIAELCGIKKTLTTHLARHTFATTVTLANGVPIESVSKMLGHNSLKTTQHYAKILDKKISEDMALLKKRLGEL